MDENEQDGYQPNFTEAATQPAMPQPPPQQPPIPMWTAADDMRFSKTSAGMNQVQDDLEAGVLHPQFALPELEKYQQKLQGMSQRKLAFDQHQQQTATQAALGQAAMRQAVQIQNGQHAASAFPSLTASHTDEKGNTTHFFQHEPGNWKQIDTPPPDESAAYLTRAPQGGGAIPAPDFGQLSPVNAGTEESPADLGTVGQTEGANQGSGEGGPATQQPFTQTIWNGQNRTDTTWQPGQTRGVSTGSWMGQPGGQPPQQQQAPDSSGAWYQKAREGMRPEPPPRVLDRFGRSVVNPDFVNYHKELDIHARNLHMDDLKRQTDERREAVKAAREDAKANADLTTKQLSDVETAERNRLTSAIHDHRLHTTDATQVPDELKGDTGKYLTPSEITAKARQIAEDKVNWLKGRRGGGQQGGSAPAQPTGPPSQQAPIPLNRPAASEQQAKQRVLHADEKPALVEGGGMSFTGRSGGTPTVTPFSDVKSGEVAKLRDEATKVGGEYQATLPRGRSSEPPDVATIESARAVLDKAARENRPLTVPEKQAYDKLVRNLPEKYRNRLTTGQANRPGLADSLGALPGG